MNMFLQLPAVFAATAFALGMPDERGGDPKGERNLATESELPRGDGLAAKYAGDQGIEAHNGVIFADNFEAGDWKTRWDSGREDKRGTLSLVDESESHPAVGKRSLKVTATLGKDHGGGLTEWFESSPTLHVRFYVKFDKNCDYVHHLCRLRGNKGLRGKDKWSGFGGAGNKPAGDERFSTGIEPWGDWGRTPAPGRWNFYTYWHEMKKSGDGRYWGNAFRPAEQSNIPRGRWICVEYMLKHNTPGKPDGEQAYWIDGELRGHWGGINWRKSEKLRANAFSLESYVTDRWTKNKINIVYFDNVVIAGEYIGPAGDAPQGGG